MRAGRAYYVFGVWDGQHLTITDDDFSLPEGFDPTMAAIIKVHEAIDPIASEALLSDNPEEELKKLPSNLKIILKLQPLSLIEISWHLSIKMVDGCFG